MNISMSARRVLLPGVLCALCACGGGSGGGSSSSPTPGPVPIGQPAGLAVIDADTVHTAAGFGLGVPDLLVEIVLSAAYRIIVLLNTGLDQLESEQDCPGLGEGRAVLGVTDTDNSNRLSTGDRVSLRFDNYCYDFMLGDLVTGEIRLDVTRAVIQRGEDLEIEGRLEFPGALRLTENKWDPWGQLTPDYIVEFTGGFRFRLRNGDASGSERIEIYADPGDFLRSTFVYPAPIVAVARDFGTVRQIAAISGPEQVRRFSLDFSHTVEGDLLDGRMTCRTTAPLETDFANWPVTGAFECDGRNGARVRLEATARDGIPDLDVLLDAGGTGSFVDAGRIPDGDGGWQEYSDGPTFFLPLPNLLASIWVDDPLPLDLLPTVSGVHRAIHVNDALHSPATNRLYVSNASGITVLDADDLTTVASVPVPGEPGPLALSADGSRLWFGLMQQGRIGSLATNTLALGSTIELGQPRPGTNFDIRRAHELVIPPGSENVVIVAMTTGEEVIAYQDGAELPSGIVIQGSPVSRLAMRDAQTIVAADDVAFGNVYRIGFASGEGLTLERSMLALGSLNGRLALGSGYFFTDSGRVFDERVPRVVAELAADEWDALSHVAVDVASATVYGVAREIGGSTLLVYDEESLALRGSYRFQHSLGLERRLLVTPTSLIVVTSMGLLRLARQDVPGYLPDETCHGEDLSGAVIPGNYVEIRCFVNDAVYDATRHRIYATIPSRAGPAGNTIAIIDPDSGTEIDRLPVGSSPTRVELSPDHTTAYVVTPGASSVSIMDLATQEMLPPAQLGFRIVEENLDAYPRFASVIAISPTNAGEFVSGSSESGFWLFRGGEAAPRTAAFLSDFSDVFLRSDGQLALATAPGRTQSMTVIADGLEELAQGEAPLPDPYAGQRGDLLYSAVGPILDLYSLTSRAGCPLPPPRPAGGRVAPDPSAALVYYAVQRDAWTVHLDSCDSGTDTWLETTSIPAHGREFGRLLAVRTVGANSLAIVFSDRILLVDRPGI
jgi:DNA-binding beta-propeller fold protein YncE